MIAKISSRRLEKNSLIYKNMDEKKNNSDDKDLEK